VNIAHVHNITTVTNSGLLPLLSLQPPESHSRDYGTHEEHLYHVNTKQQSQKNKTKK
jgi:hypothetical protein